jgi:peptide/nickel transport system permease protein
LARREKNVCNVVLDAGAKFLASLLVIGFFTMCLVRFAPGFGVDERELDSRLSNESIEALRMSSEDENVFRSYYLFLQRAAGGDFGFSKSLNHPVAELIQQRYIMTMIVLALGLLLGWSAAFLLAAATTAYQIRMISFLGTAGATAVLCVPSALLAYVCYLVHAPASFVVGLIIFARVFRIVENVFQNARQKIHILAARAYGSGDFRIFCRHILSDTSGELIALAGASVSMAVSATIAAEALCDVPGLGQMAWKAALARDLPLLVSLTLLIGTATLLCNRVADTLLRVRETRA